MSPAVLRSLHILASALHQSLFPRFPFKTLTPVLRVEQDKDWLVQLCRTKPHLHWEEIHAQINHEKMIHVVTDGGA
jgi:hypothetical protein